MADEMLKNAQPQELESQIGEEDGLKEQLLRMCRQNKLAAFSAVLILVVILIAIFAPVLAPYGEAEQDLISRLQGPSAAHWFGTDELGRDVFSRILYGSRLSLTIGILPSIISLVVGIFFGLLAGYFGGWVDYVIMRLADIMLSIPSLLLAMVVMYTLGQSTVNLFIALSLTSWASVARVVRSQALSLKESEYVEAARSIGVSNGKIMLKHILPNCISTILVQLTLDLAYAILDLASLSFLGLGTLPPQADWGAMLDEGRSVLLMSPVQSLSAGIVIVIVVVSLNIFSDGLHQYLDQAQTALPSFRKYEKKFLKKKGGAADGKPA